MNANPAHAFLSLMEFVDDFRRRRDPSVLVERFIPRSASSPAASDDDALLAAERFEAIAASTAERLCAELGITAPDWLEEVPPCRTPWFVSGLESLKAIAIVESPAHFRVRRIFVLENFLDRA